MTDCLIVFLISYLQSLSRPQVPAKKYTTKTSKERTIVKFVPERGWMANKHIMKILLQEKCAKENNVVKRLEKKKKKRKKEKRKTCMQNLNVK